MRHFNITNMSTPSPTPSGKITAVNGKSCGTWKPAFKAARKISHVTRGEEDPRLGGEATAARPLCCEDDVISPQKPTPEGYLHATRSLYTVERVF